MGLDRIVCCPVKPGDGEMNHTKRRLSTGAGSISQDEARNPSPGNLGLVATISGWLPNTAMIQARYS